jgi:hypothetical protein
MSDKALGKLERVELRDVWLSEAADFTPWLARPENLVILAETLDLELDLEAQEKTVGPFRADILCKDTGTDSWVLIENQLERTDHTHLGQLLTYAAGLQTVAIVWIAARFTEEHRATLDWLNEITDPRFRFFGLEVELWRIAGSPPAPRFNIISKPNDWSKAVGRAARRIDEEPVSETKALQLRYWQALNAYLEAHTPGIRTRLPKPRHWINFSIGRTGFHLSARMSTAAHRIRAGLFFRCEDTRDTKAAFALLKVQRADIERIVGEPLIWEEAPDRIGCRIALDKTGVDPTDEADWSRQHAWLADALVRLDKAFRQRVRALDIADAKEGLEPAA